MPTGPTWGEVFRGIAEDLTGMVSPVIDVDSEVTADVIEPCTCTDPELIREDCPRHWLLGEGGIDPIASAS